MVRTTAPNSSGGLYVDDDAGIPVIGTTIIADDKNITQEELCNIVEDFGVSLSGASDQQISDILQDLLGLISSGANGTLLTVDSPGGQTYLPKRIVPQNTVTFADDTLNAGITFQNTDGSFKLVNNTATVDQFAPLIKTELKGSGNSFEIIGNAQTGEDTGTIPIMTFQSTVNDGAVSTRPVFSFKNYTTTNLLINAAGNIGFNTTDIEAWNSSYNAIEAYRSAIMMQNDGTGLNFLSNAYFDGTWKYKSTGPAVLAGMSGGIYTLNVAVSGTIDTAISWIETLRITNDGKLSSGGEIAPDVDTGGLCLNQGSGTSYILTTKSSTVAHGMTDLAETDTYAALLKSNSSGGLQIRGFTSADSNAIRLIPIATAPGTGHNGTAGPFTISVSKKSGTTNTALTSNERMWNLVNANTWAASFLGNGSFKTAAGRWPTDDLHTATTGANVYSNIAPYIPNIGDEIIVSGCLVETTPNPDEVIVVSRIRRSGATSIDVYGIKWPINGATIVTRVQSTISSVSTVNYECSLAW